jgi:S1-C subfamily serine protease
VADTQVPDTQASGARYYYSENKILLPEWVRTVIPPRPLWKRLLPVLIPLLLLLIGGLAALWLLWLGPMRNLKLATVMVMADVDGDGQITPEGDRQGSGVIISPDGSPGYVLTCRHVLMEPGETACGYVEIWYQPGTPRCEKIKATLEKPGEPYRGTDQDEIRARDWAVLKFTRPGKLPHLMNSARKDFQEEEKIKAAGFPLGWQPAQSSYGPSVEILNGRITRVDRNDQQAPVRLTHDADLAEGMSGGPLTMGGKLVGLNVAVIKSETGAQQNLALPTYLLQESVFGTYQKGK